MTPCFIDKVHLSIHENQWPVVYCIPSSVTTFLFDE